MEYGVFPFDQINIPESELSFFYALTKWYETNKSTKLKAWGKAAHKLKNLKFQKPESGKKLIAPKTLEENTLYFPTFNFGAKNVIEHVRHAFCHNGLVYDNTTNQYTIRKTDKIHLDASFSFEAFKELSIFFKK